MFKLVNSLLVIFLLSVQVSFAQSKYLPSAIRIGTDVGAIGQSVFTPNKTRYEINADIDLDKYFLSVDLGRASSSYPEIASNYTTEGQYFRIGPDVNFLGKHPDHSVLFLGARYARSYFSEILTYTIDDELLGVIDRRNVNGDISGRWFELTAGMKVKIWQQFFIGYTFRVKFAGKVIGSQSFPTYEIPGYGRTENDTNFSAAYHIFYRLPFRKK